MNAPRPSPAGKNQAFDVIVIGAGAAGLFCAAQAGQRGKSVLVIDHATKIGEKIRISGGGRCNFTNLNTAPENFLSQNPKFAVSALSRYSPRDFVALVDRAGIKWHEKKLGQLFCDDSATQIISLLMDGCAEAGVVVKAGTKISAVTRDEDGFHVTTSAGDFSSHALVVATGGKSIPKIGASGFGYEIAAQFGLRLVETRPALVPLTFTGAEKEMAAELAGVSVEASVTVPRASGVKPGARNKPPAFRDGFLFTHRGLSGPSILQISSYWREGVPLSIDLCPAQDAFETLKSERSANGRASVAAALSSLVPKSVAASIAKAEGWTKDASAMGDGEWDKNLADMSDARLRAMAQRLHEWTVSPAGSEGYRTAEVTLGGVNTDDLNSRTMEARQVPGLYFIGEVVDVTGWLGGYNFQWAWASAFAAACAMAEAG